MFEKAFSDKVLLEILKTPLNTANLARSVLCSTPESSFSGSPESPFSFYSLNNSNFLSTLPVWIKLIFIQSPLYPLTHSKVSLSPAQIHIKYKVIL